MTRALNPAGQIQVSQFDLAFFLAGVFVAVVLSPYCWWAGAVVWFVVGNFFLFTNVFRVSLMSQVGWAGVFTLLAVSTILNGQPGWTATFAFSFALALALIIWEMKSSTWEWLGINSARLSDLALRHGESAEPVQDPVSVGGVSRHSYIDSLRGYAILGVILVHSSLQVQPVNPHLHLLMTFGLRGVELFFVVSALTLCLSWEHRSTRETMPLRNFFVRRFFRIAPMFYVAIVLYLLFDGMEQRPMAMNDLKWWHILVTALFLHGFSPETVNSVVPGGWSIAVEMCFYLILPVVAVRVRSVRACLILLLASIVVAKLSGYLLYGWLSVIYPHDQQYLVAGFVAKNILVKLPVFAAGMLACCILRDGVRSQKAVVIGLLLLAPVLQAEASLTGSAAGTLILNPVHAGVLFALFALMLATFPPRIMVNSWIAAVGKISFSMYLLHFLVLDCVARFLPAFEGDGVSLLHFMLVAMVTAGLASITYRCIELPGIALGRKLVSRWENNASNHCERREAEPQEN
ncbi:MAG: acyltransferase [Verrucomicrobia bacterium]|nr:acyltransferase [Verrucomicrobiota bacterium]